MSHVQNDCFRACNSRPRYCELLRCCVALASILVILRSFYGSNASIHKIQRARIQASLREQLNLSWFFFDARPLLPK